MKPLGTWIGPGRLAGILALAGCGLPFTTATGGSGGSGGAVPDGGQGGVSTSSGASTTSSSSMCTGCGPGTLCSGGKCVACIDLDMGTTFSFGMPQPIPLTAPPPSGQALSPRVEPTTSTLFFVAGAPNQGRIAQALQVGGSWSAWTLMPPPFNPVGQAQQGPLPWPDGMEVAELLDTTAVKPSKPILLFGSGDALVAANLDALPTTPSPSPLNVPPFALGDRSIAVAFSASPPRFFWLRGGQLRTATSAGTATGALVTVPFDGCTPDPMGAINDPWVRPDGKRLLFSAPSYSGDACAEAPSSQSRLFYVDLDAGVPTGSATQIFPGDMNDDDQTPSLSPDGCSLLFARSGVLMAAPRQ